MYALLSRGRAATHGTELGPSVTQFRLRFSHVD